MTAVSKYVKHHSPAILVPGPSLSLKLIGTVKSQTQPENSSAPEASTKKRVKCSGKEDLPYLIPVSAKSPTFCRFCLSISIKLQPRSILSKDMMMKASIRVADYIYLL